MIILDQEWHVLKGRLGVRGSGKDYSGRIKACSVQNHLLTRDS
jgi:hypothetical protein